MGNSTRHSTAARATPVPLARTTRGSSVVPQMLQLGFYPNWRCAGSWLAVLGSDDGHLPPRSFLRDKPSSRFSSSRSRRCDDRRRPGASATCQTCHVDLDSRSRPGTETASPRGWAVASSLYLLASASLEVEGLARAPRRSPPLAAAALAPAPAWNC